MLVIVPCLNEEDHIENVVARVAAEADRIDLKVVVADGGSNDRSRSIVHRLSSLNPRIVLLDNPKRIQAAGVNSAVREYGGDAKFLIRVDAHSTYPDRYCQTLLDVQARTLARFCGREYARVRPNVLPKGSGSRAKFCSRQWRIRTSQRYRRSVG